eukprot:351484-Chlamydomonas_euryale.AAC.2
MLTTSRRCACRRGVWAAGEVWSKRQGRTGVGSGRGVEQETRAEGCGARDKGGRVWAAGEEWSKRQGRTGVEQETTADRCGARDKGGRVWAAGEVCSKRQGQTGVGSGRGVEQETRADGCDQEGSGYTQRPLVSLWWQHMEIHRVVRISILDFEIRSIIRRSYVAMPCFVILRGVVLGFWGLGELREIGGLGDRASPIVPMAKISGRAIPSPGPAAKNVTPQVRAYGMNSVSINGVKLPCAGQ